MLQIMETRGCLATKELAEEFKTLLACSSAANAKGLYIYTYYIHVFL